MSRKIESLLLPGPAGALEALLEEPEDGQPREVCVVCHPHPLYGGTMHNKVVHRMARALRRSGFAVLRFNFRGVGLSQGTHDFGNGETEDARQALEWLRARYLSVPYSLAGFSFGSRVILRLGCGLEGVSRLIAAGYPIEAGELPGLENCRAPKLFIQSTHDQYGPVKDLEALFARLQKPKRLVLVEAADHFFAGALDRFEEIVYELTGDSAGG